MELREKIAWLKQAGNEELLLQYHHLMQKNDYGCNDEDIELTRDEILARMKKTVKEEA